MRSILLATFALLAAAAPASEWRLRLPITLAPGSGVQRLDVPLPAILASERADGGDIRVLDANGRAQPLARLPAPVPPPRRVPLDPLPILGASDALRVTGVTLRLEDGRARVAQVDGAPAGAGQELLGVLLDTRRTDAPARELALELTAPANQPITVTLEASTDLRNWTAEREQVLFATRPTATLTMPLRDETVRGRMLRVTWRAQGRLLSPVAITRATLVLAGSPDAARLPVRATLPPLADAHTAAFVMPFAIAPAAVMVEPADGVPTPVRIFGRANREQPWTEIGSGVAAAPRFGGPHAITIAGAYREWRIEGAGDGFDTPPRLELRFDARAIAFLPTGTLPYTLVVGRADAAASFLPMRTLVQMEGDATADMPTATVLAAASGPVPLPALATGATFKTWLLWSVLFLGVAGLSGIAWVLVRPARSGSLPSKSNEV